MEIILAIVVTSAVIIFGALISIGNERQKKAIDGLREQVVLWAVQDLKIKREHLAQTVHVSDPLGWLDKIASKILGYDPKLQVLQTFEEPRSLICKSDHENIRIAFSSQSPVDLRRTRRRKQNRLSRSMVQNPLLSLPQNLNAKEVSVLNGGYSFDLELALVWKELTGQEATLTESLWVYIWE